MKHIPRLYRRPVRRLSVAGLALLALTSAASADAPAPTERILGRWITESRNLEVEIAPCGVALCGTVTRVLANRSMQNLEVEVKSFDGRPALGMTILSEFTSAGGGEWNGKIYNRENGKTYKCVIVPLGPTQLSVRGYVLLPLFGKTQIWNRVVENAEANR